MNLELKNISKNFPGVKALDAANVHFRGGQIHAICGENGAGKSTLLNIVTSNLQPDEGEIFLDGKKINFSSPQEAFENGIAIVYQHLSLVDSLSIAENIYASFPPSDKYGFLNRRKMILDTKKLLAELNLSNLGAEQLVRSLSAGQKQMVEIAKALSHRPQIVFFDEPTASVSGKDAAILFEIIGKLKAAGTAVIYISHRMKEIFGIADIVTVMKDGKTQGTFPIDEVDNEKLIRLMVGRNIDQLAPTALAGTKSLLEVNHLGGPGFEDISFTIHKGEIIGMAGLIGAGRTEIAKAIFGAVRTTNGFLKINERPVEKFTHPYSAMKNGIAYITEDRRQEGLFLDKSVAENIGVTELASQSSYDPFAMVEVAESYCKTLNIKTPSVQKKVAELSGGNQQKVLLAKWLQVNAEILILDEPTHGIDAGAKSEIYKIIQDLASEGKGILLISSELPELLHLCHRIIVIKEGKIMGTLLSTEATEEKILSLAMQSTGRK